MITHNFGVSLYMQVLSLTSEYDIILIWATLPTAACFTMWPFLGPRGVPPSCYENALTYAVMKFFMALMVMYTVFVSAVLLWEIEVEFSKMVC
mmetsp:Transcript_33149/g.45925  ORF Transcript_33149/g.45925 Transcript_33149/m.45925 type:complete len:93 (+) Transcript_33149:618-896(+)